MIYRMMIRRDFDEHFPLGAILLQELHLANGIRRGIDKEIVELTDDLRSVSNIAVGCLKLVVRPRLQIEEDRLRRATGAPVR